MRLLVLALVVSMVGVAGLTCAIMSLTDSLAAPAAAPAPTPSAMELFPVYPAGVMCTFPVERFEAVLNASCLPPALNDSATYTYCVNRRATNDSSCVIAACTVYIAYAGSLGRSFDLAYTSSDKLRLVNTNASDLGSVRVAHMLRQLMIDNRPDSDGGPPPQPLDYVGGLTFYTTDVGVLSFQVSSRTLARELAAFKWNYASLVSSTLNPAPNAVVNLTVVSATWITPTRCPSADVAAIPWLRTSATAINVPALYTLARGLITLNLTSTEAEWPIACLDVAVLPAFCQAFETHYYSFESLTNYSIVPSPYRDVLALMKAFNEEYVDCGVPRGCFGTSRPL